jgi:chromosome segregation ATPase
MKKSWSVVGLVLVAAVAGVSCDKFKQPQPEIKPPATVSGQISADDKERERGEFTLAARKELDDLKATIASFKEKVASSSTQTQAKLGEEVAKLDADLTEAEQRLTELTTSTLESWGQFKESFSRSLDKLKGGVESFRKNPV